MSPKSLKMKKRKTASKKLKKTLQGRVEVNSLMETLPSQSQKLIKSKSSKKKKSAVILQNLVKSSADVKHDIAKQPSLNEEKSLVVKKQQSPTKSLKEKKKKGSILTKSKKKLKETMQEVKSPLEELSSQMPKQLVKSKNLKKKKSTIISPETSTKTNDDIAEQPRLFEEKMDVKKKKNILTKSLKKKKAGQSIIKKLKKKSKESEVNSLLERVPTEKQKKMGRSKSLRKKKSTVVSPQHVLNSIETNRDNSENPSLNQDEINTDKKKKIKKSLKKIGKSVIKKPKKTLKEKVEVSEKLLSLKKKKVLKNKSLKKKKSTVISPKNYIETNFDIAAQDSYDEEKVDVEIKKALIKSIKRKKKELALKKPKPSFEDKVEVNSLIEELGNYKQKNLINDLSLTELKNEVMQPKNDLKAKRDTDSLVKEQNTTQETLNKTKSSKKKKKKKAQLPKVSENSKNANDKKCLLNDHPEKKRKLLTPKKSAKKLKAALDLLSRDTQKNSTVLNKDADNVLEDVTEQPILNQKKLNQKVNRKSIIESLKKKKILQSQLAEEDFLNVKVTNSLMPGGIKRKNISKDKSFSFVKKVKFGLPETQSAPKDEMVTKNDTEGSTVDADQSQQEENKEKKPRKEILVQRSEARLVVSEFNLSEFGKEKVTLRDLLKPLNKTGNQLVAQEQLWLARELKLKAPLHPHEIAKHERAVAYEKVCDDIKKWDPVVKRNRLAEQTVFPLKKPEISIHAIDKLSEKFVTKTPLEEEVARLLNNSENVAHKTRMLTIAEEKALRAMSMEEAKERHASILRQRALISFKAARDKFKSKIKSKKYHRLLKRQKLKNMMKEFEELEKTDPKAAYEQYLKTDKLRIIERTTLKHKGLGKWSRMQKIRAKYNPDSRLSLKEDSVLGKQLKEKLLDDEKLEFLRDQSSGQTVEDKPVSHSESSYNLVEDCVRQSNLEKLFDDPKFKSAAKHAKETAKPAVHAEDTDESDDDDDSDVEEDTAECAVVEHYEQSDDTAKHVVEPTIEDEHEISPVFDCDLIGDSTQQIESIDAPDQRNEENESSLPTTEISKPASKNTIDFLQPAEDCVSSVKNTKHSSKEKKKVRVEQVKKSEGNLKGKKKVQVEQVKKPEKDSIEKKKVQVEQVKKPAEDSIEKKKVQVEQIKKPEEDSIEKKKVQIEADIGFSTEVKFLESMVPDDITGGDEDLDDVDEDAINIQQAFADEGLIAEFCEEKKTAERNNKVEGIDLFLPGWGSWGGPDIKPSEQQKRKFYIEPPKEPFKKNDSNTVIFNEDKDSKAAVHQVSKVPYPFRSYKQFKSHVRQPIGNTWNPQSSFQALVAPKIVTKMGKIIEPIDTEDVVFEKRENALHEKQIKMFNSTQKARVF